MEIKGKLSGIEMKFTPDEWEQAKKLGDFMVADIEQMNKEFLEKMIENPHKTVRQIENDMSNTLLRVANRVINL